MRKRVALKTLHIRGLALALLLLLLAAQLAACALSTTGPEPATVSPSPTTIDRETAPAATPTPAATATSPPAPTATPSVTPRPPTPVPTSTSTPAATATPTTVTFAVIGDYGLAGAGEAAVADLVDSWEPAFIITVGDNNYPDGEAETIDANIGQYYADYIHPYHGAYTTTVAAPDVNRFFPSLGNHDFYGPDGAEPYLDYFTLPGNERYYDFQWGPLHLFALNSDFNEPDGVGANSAQAQWLQERLAASTAPWQIVYFHVPPYSSGHHGAGAWMRWPFPEWGADAVLAGHDHHYERLHVDGIPYFVNGLGGGAIYAVEEPVSGSQVRFSGTHGAMRVAATTETITFEFITRTGELIDQHTISR